MVTSDIHHWMCSNIRMWWNNMYSYVVYIWWYHCNFHIHFWCISNSPSFIYILCRYVYLTACAKQSGFARWVCTSAAHRLRRCRRRHRHIHHISRASCLYAGNMVFHLQTYVLLLFACVCVVYIRICLRCSTTVYICLYMYTQHMYDDIRSWAWHRILRARFTTHTPI